MSMFDGIQKAVVSTIQNIMGDTAVWIPLDWNKPIQTAKVLYNNSETNFQLGDTNKYDYSPYVHSIEYYIDQFTGLKQSVEEGNVEEIKINGSKYFVKEIKPKFDGKVLIAYLEPCEDEL
jgi:hypothetical protein